MGSSSSKETAEILQNIAHPDNEAELRTIFAKFDKNKSGSLDKAEWAAFGKYLYQADVELSLKDGEKEVKSMQTQDLR